MARGSISRDGTFRLTTYVAEDGAVAGKHDVLIVQKFTADIDSMQEHAEHAARTRTLDARYSKYSTSGLAVSIDPRGDNSHIILEVESR